MGIASFLLLLNGPLFVDRVGLDIHTFLVACFAMLVGLQCVCFAIIARRSATARGLMPPSPRYAALLGALTLERLLLAALALGIAGAIGVVWCAERWASAGFGSLQYGSLLKVLIPSLTAITAAMQLAFVAFLDSILNIAIRRD